MTAAASRVGRERPLVVAAFVAVLLVNGLANGLPLGGRTTGEVSALYPSPFTPAGFTFSIWGVIYLALLGFAVFQALPAQQASETIARIRGPFAVSCAANCAWIFAWHYDQLALSLVVMVVLLVTLAAIYRTLRRAPVATTSERLCVRVPFSVYTAWICVATIANASALQTAMDWDAAGLDPVAWTIGKLALAGTVGVIVSIRCHDAAFALVVGWAAFGIASARTEPAIAGAAALLATLALLVAAVEVVRGIRSALARRGAGSRAAAGSAGGGIR
jgi:hypothetical protein